MVNHLPKYWVKGDLNGFFGLFTNNLTNLIVMSSLLTFAVGLPADIVYGSIVPAVGVTILVSALCYFYMGLRLVKKLGTDRVTALPSGISVPHMFLIVFMIIGPVYSATGSPFIAWASGVAWAFVEGIIELCGSFFGKKIRNLVPRPAMLGALAGVSLTFIALNPAFDVWAMPYIGLVSLSIVLIGWVGKTSMPFNIPTGLFAIIIGTVIGFFGKQIDFGAAVAATKDITLSLPAFSITRIIGGFKEAAPFIVSAIPLGLYNFLETIDNIESASVAGDDYSVTAAMVIDGSTSVLGSLLGSPFPTAIYIGHPGWKETGARLGYVFLNGVIVFLLSILGLFSVLLEIIPIAAIIPILMYIGIVIATQAFKSSDAKYYPAIILALVPWMSDWTRNAVNIVLGATGSNAAKVGYDTISSSGLNYSGMETLGNGAIIVSMLLASFLVFIVDRKFKKALVVSALSAIMSFFGIIHANAVGLFANINATIGYLLVSLLLIFFIKIRRNDEI